MHVGKQQVRDTLFAETGNSQIWLLGSEVVISGSRPNTNKTIKHDGGQSLHLHRDTLSLSQSCPQRHALT